MRLGWSVICRDYGRLDDGTIVLHRVFTDTILELSLPQPGPALAPLDPTFVLVSYWYKESDAESRLHPAILRISAPGDNQEIGRLQFNIDLRNSRSRLTTFRFRPFRYISDGLYEIQIEAPEFGGWNVTSHNGLNVVGRAT